ncbi:ABC transporter ATP-binding protein [Streptomyces varsoviensis]|uniref:ABC transporter ATP-binding protein n=1 Tax=Streptomyces varsoviensis TaxID=67373 RepID=UPI0009966A62|nr:ABC transporter ATP-binding protein [Streptomyces varsoviensis]
MSELVFEDVSVRYGSRRGGLTAVDGVNLTVPSGQVVGLVGESGSGKSTLARSAVGLAPLTAGRVLLDGTDVRRWPGRRRPLQMVFQDPYSSLDPRMTIGASISEAMPMPRTGVRFAGRRAAARRAEVARLLELVNLDPDRADMLPGHLSGGQRQRVALARALAGRPRVVIADEITSALDVSVQGAVLNLVRDVRRQLGLSMLFVSHNLAVVRYLSDIVAVMYLGRIVEAGPTEQVLSDPQHPYTRELLSAAPSWHTPLFEGSRDFEGSDAEPSDPHRPPAGCRYHPRCALGPRARPDRDVCRTADPARDAERRPHRAACHFAGEDYFAGEDLAGEDDDRQEPSALASRAPEAGRLSPTSPEDHKRPGAGRSSPSSAEQPARPGADRPTPPTGGPTPPKGART